MIKDLKSFLATNNLKPLLLITSIFLAIIGEFFLYRSGYHYGHLVNFMKLDFIAPTGAESAIKGVVCIVIAIILFILTIKDYKFDNTEDWKFFGDYKSGFEKKNRTIAIVLFVITLLLTIFISYNLYIKNYELYYLFIWALSFITAGAGIYYWENKKFTLSVFKLDIYEVIFFILLAVFYFIIVFSLLEYIPYYVETDEGSFGLFTKELFVGKHNWWSNLWGAWPALSHFPAYFTMLHFGIDVYGLRISSVITGFLCIYPFYYGMRAAFDKHIAAISAIILVSSSLFIGFSRTGYPNIQSVLIFILIFAFVIFYFKTGEFLYVYIAGIATGASFYTYLANKAFIITVPLFFLLVLVFYRQFWKQTLKAIMLGIIALFLCIYPHYLSIANNTEPVVVRTSTIFYLADQTSFEHTSNQFNERNKLLLFAKALINSSLVFNYQCGMTSTSPRYTRPILEFFSSILFLFGFIFLLMRLKDIRFMFIAVNFLVYLLLMALTLEPPCVHRYLVFVPMTSIICGYSLFNVADLLSRSFNKIFWQQAIFKMVVVISLLIIVLSNYEVFFHNFVYKRSALSMYEKKTLAAKIVKKYKGKHKIYFVYNNFAQDFSKNSSIINSQEFPLQFVLNDRYYKHIIEIDQGGLPVKKKVTKDVVFLVDTFLNKPVNYILNSYENRKIFIMYNLNNDALFVIIKVPKEEINSKIESGLLNKQEPLQNSLTNQST